jgi:cell division protein FtsB
MMRTWNIGLPEQVEGYAQKIESMRDDKARLEAELKKLRKLIDDD